jgi:hypothetical protein
MVQPSSGQRGRLRRLAGGWLATFALATQLATLALVPLQAARLATADGWLAGAICHAGDTFRGDRQAPAPRHAPPCPLCPLCLAQAHAGLLPPPPAPVPAPRAPVRLRLAMKLPAHLPVVRPSGAACPRGPPARV